MKRSESHTRGFSIKGLAGADSGVLRLAVMELADEEK